MAADLVVVGLGYVGLPLARRACEVGLVALGYDVDAAVVLGLNSGNSHVGDVRDSDIRMMLDAGFTATTDPSVLAGASTVVLCVPTGLSVDRRPDLTAVRDAVTTVADHVRPGTLVVLESTSYPGTTEELARPLLEQRSGLLVGEDIYLAYSPERIDPGNGRFALHNTPKIVSGCTPLCAKAAVAFYERIVEATVLARGTREAEMVKLLENTYRYVNIALVNEVAMYCQETGIDVWDVLRCAATKPFGFSSFRPGPGVGGHCIPVDPVYLATKAEADGFAFQMLSAAHEVHRATPGHVVRRGAGLLADRGTTVRGARVLLLGVTYKADVADTRESPAFPVALGFLERGATVSYHDPFVSEFRLGQVSLPRRRSLGRAVADADLAVLLQDHSCYGDALLSNAACAVLDTRGIVSTE